MKEKIVSNVKELRKKQQMAKDKFKAMKQSSETAWEALKQGVSDSIDTLKDSIDKAAAEIK